MIQLCLLIFLSQHSCLPSFNETNIFAEFIYILLNSSFPEWFFFLLVFHFFFFIIIPKDWLITNSPDLTSWLSSTMLLFCTLSITSTTSLVFSVNLTLSIHLRLWGFGKLSFFISSTIFSSKF